MRLPGRLRTPGWRRVGLAVLVVACSLLCVAVALGRPGGGGSFSSGGGSSRGGSSSSGGGSSSSGGGGGGGIADALIGFLVELLVRLLIDLVVWLVTTYPAIGVPLLLGLAVAIFALSAKHRWAAVTSVLGLIGVTVAFQKSLVAGYVSTGGMLIGGLLYVWLAPDRSWSTRSAGSTVAPSIEPPINPPAPRRASQDEPRAMLAGITEYDPDFSAVLFDDFAYLLFAAIHQARGGDGLARVAPYITEKARQRLASRPVAAVRDVIIGAMRVISVAGVGKNTANQTAVSVLLEFEANYTEVDRDGREQGFYTIERWQLMRDKAARSRPPGESYVLPCPACGAPLELAVGGACKYCQKVVEDRSLSWGVVQITLVRREERGPVLTSDAQEQGTDLPTIVAPGTSERLARLQARDPAFDQEALRRRVELIFAALQVGWGGRDLTGVRPFVSDNLYQSLGYWIEAYRKAKLRNVTEQAKVWGLELAQVSSDRFFDAITLRVQASSLDFVLGDGDDRTVLSGSREQPRVYTEYWTLIRSATRQGAASDTSVCPGCGAPLAITMAGRCEHCQAKVTAGEFDWVLSRIEQDEVYTG